jgi:hypothetical protein
VAHQWSKGVSTEHLEAVGWHREVMSTREIPSLGWHDRGAWFPLNSGQAGASCIMMIMIFIYSDDPSHTLSSWGIQVFSLNVSR